MVLARTGSGLALYISQQSAGCQKPNATKRDIGSTYVDVTSLMLMTPLTFISALFLAMVPVFAFADGFVIEDERLTALPMPIEAAIRSVKGFEYSACKLIGKPVDLLGQGTNSGFIATTADGCDWGAALGPIWVVRDGAQPVTVLAHGGYSLTLGKQLHNGLRNVAISAATAGWSSESLWKFDGARYVKVKEKNGANR